MSDLEVKDARERRKIVKEIDRTFLVEAGAGSGKTKSLVDRMLALLREGRCGIETLAAVTFTRKAAAELRGRFQTELEKAVRNEGDEKVKERLGDALQRLEQCYIGTIHSFCARIIRERPLEIALDPEFREMEEIEDAVYREKYWHEYLLKVRLEDDPVLKRLEEVDLVPEDLREAFVVVSLFPEVKLMSGSERPPDYAAYREKLQEFIKDARKVVPREPPKYKGYDGLMRLMRRCFFREQNLGFNDHRILMETFELFTRSSGYRKTYWPDKEEGEAFNLRFESFRDEVADAALKEWREYRHPIVLDFLKPAVEFYAARRREQARVNYGDLLLLTARLLRDNPEVRAYFQKKYTHILVDEFQDTDPVQAEILMYLCGTDPEESDWRRLEPRPGSLFLVGDPKQSIFRFRRADIDTYNLVKERIEKAGGEVLPLTANFRSLHSLRDWINPVFAEIFPERFTRFQAAFASLDTVRADAQGALSGVYKITVPKVERNRRAGIAEIDAGAIGDFIHWACAGNLRLARSPEEKEQGKGPEAGPDDFLVLFRYKKQMEVYARALEERGIPYEITGSAAFAESEEIQEIVNLARALNEPDNPIYTVAVLRGLFFGVSDNELLQYKRVGGRFNYLSEGLSVTDKDVDPEKSGEFKRAIDRGFDQASEGVTDADPAGRMNAMNTQALCVAACLAQMREWWEWTKTQPASTALERILESTGIIAYLASGDMGSSKAGNLIKLLEILRGQEQQGLTAFSDIAEFMSNLLGLYDIEEMSLTPGRTNAVRLMNLHKAKGLEAPVVFLANPPGGPDHEPDRHIKRMEEAGPTGYFVFSRSRGWQRSLLSQPLDWEERAVEEQEYQDAEEMRLMYVAATRARNLLVISTYGPGSTNRAWKALDDNLEGVPELEFPTEAGPSEKEKLILFPGDFERGREDIRAGWSKASTPSYAVSTVTSLAKAGAEAPLRGESDAEKPLGGESDAAKHKRGESGAAKPIRGESEVAEPLRGESGFGMSWGRAVHTVLEALGRGRVENLDLLLENVLAVEERDPAEKALLKRLIEGITASDFWKRALNAEKRFFEVPFGIKASGLELGRDDMLPVRLTGTIDLVFWEKDGWVIADYKTDEIREDLQAYVDYYAPQVRLYSRFWEQITGQHVIEAGLYFTSIDQWIALRQK